MFEAHAEKYGPKKGKVSGLIETVSALARRTGGKVEVVRRGGNEEAA